MACINFKSGYTVIVGRSNVGKSTLLNRILGQKLCITSRRLHTTRHRILGIKTLDHSQLIYADTPGMYANSKQAIHRYMNKVAVTSIDNVDVVLFVIEAPRWTDEDQFVLNYIKDNAEARVVLILNKVDNLADKNKLLPYIMELATKYNFANIVPISARKGINVACLEDEILRLMPKGELIFPEEALTDRSSRFLAAELVREKLFRYLGQELPYSISVEIERFEQQDDINFINAVIYVERFGQKNIVIGKKGALLRMVGKDARIEMERLFSCKVFLRTWVKVREGWSDNELILKNFGYNYDS